MRGCFLFICAALLSSSSAPCQQPNASKASDPANQANVSSSNGSPSKVDPSNDQTEKDQTKKVSDDTALKDLFAAKIKVEWDALKNKDKKTYAELLADEYQGVETDGQGERNKMQAIAEVSETNVANYTLWGLKVTPLGPDATFIVYEVTIQFPPGSAIRFSRLYIGALWVKQNGQWKELHYQETNVK